jgi:transposase-like protein
MIHSEIKNRFTGEVVAKIETQSSIAVGDDRYKNIQLPETDLRRSKFSKMNLRKANFFRAVLTDSSFVEADLRGADFSMADLSHADFSKADLSGANLEEANCVGAIFKDANLSDAKMKGARCSKASFIGAIIAGVDFKGASLFKAKGLYKVMGVEPGNVYWKRFNQGLKSNDCHFQYKLGLNVLTQDFAGDDRETCSFPGFHFGSKSWCSWNYPNRPLEAKVRIPEGALINEPYATDGTASADRIEILQVFDAVTGEDVTSKFRGIENTGKVYHNKARVSCKFCGADKATKEGYRKTKAGSTQRYFCHNCYRSFSRRGRSWTSVNDKSIVNAALRLFASGYDLDKISLELKRIFNICPAWKTIDKWIKENQWKGSHHEPKKPGNIKPTTL